MKRSIVNETHKHSQSRNDYNEDEDEENDQLAQVAQSFIDEEDSSGSGFSSFNVYTNARLVASSSKSVAAASTPVSMNHGGEKSSSERKHFDPKSSDARHHQKSALAFTRDDEYDEYAYNLDDPYDMNDGETVERGGTNEDIDDDDDGDTSSIDSNIDDILQYSIDDAPSGTVNMNEINFELQSLQRRIETSSLKTQSGSPATMTVKNSSPQQLISSLNQSTTTSTPTTTHSFPGTKRSPVVPNTPQQMNERKEYESQIRELERRVTELEEKLRVSENNEQHSKEAYDNEAELTNQLKDINTRLSVTISAQSRQIDVLQQELQVQTDSNNHKQLLVSQLEQQNAINEKNYTQQLSDLKKKLHRAVQEIKKQRAFIDRIRANEIQQKNQLETQKSNIINELKSTIETLKASNIEMETRCNSMFEENSRLRKNSAELFDERNALEQDRDNKQEQLSNLQQEFKTFETEFRKVKSKYDEFSKHYAEMVRERKEEQHTSGGSRSSSRESRVAERKRPQSASAATQKMRSHLNIGSSPSFQSQGDVGVSSTSMKSYSAPPKVRTNSARTPSSEKRESTEQDRMSNDSLFLSDQPQDYLDIPFYKDTRYLKQKLLTERKRVELKNIEIAGLKEMLYKSQLKSKEKTKSAAKKRIQNELSSLTR